jgi:CubicO group peptidase (beta-lactamase class C family)
MTPRFKNALLGLTLLLLILVAAGGWYLNQAVPIGTGHAAKYLCSYTFISGLEPERVFQEDVRVEHFLFDYMTYEVDPSRKTVSVDLMGLFGSRAIYREGCGCTLLTETSEADLRAQTFMLPASGAALSTPDPAAPWPEGNAPASGPPPAGVDPARLTRALDEAFSEAEPVHPVKTRAVVVVYDGRIVAERYAPGFTADTPLLGWSMTKSVTNALVGVLVGKGLLDLQAPAPVPEWRSDGNPRSRITLDQLLKMSSGLEFDEDYSEFGDATEMLYRSSDFAAYAARKPLAAEPGELWNYSGGTANILARIVRQSAGRLYENYYGFLHHEFFDRIGMSSAVIEPDPSGTFVGSSYAFATPRDWARFGLLFLQEGIWDGQRVLPADWVAYTVAPAPAAPRGQYGALFWLNAGSASDPTDREWPEVPPDAFYASGHHSQSVVVIPSRKLVLVRFGFTLDPQAWDHERFILNVLDALPAPAPAAGSVNRLPLPDASGRAAGGELRHDLSRMPDRKSG